MEISVITSLYRSASYLDVFVSHLVPVVNQVLAAGKSLEVIILANDATPEEQVILNQLPDNLSDTIQVHYIPRETLYASWNRGVQLAQGEAIGFWNVDDIRTAEGLLEGHELIKNGCHVYYSKYIIKAVAKYYGIPDKKVDRVRDMPAFDRELFTHEPIAGPFFMFSAQAIEQYGLFDERFEAFGDFEWWVRVAKHTSFCQGETINGTFLFHGTNLSLDRQNAIAERNIIHLLHGNYAELQWMNPNKFNAMLVKWGDDIPQIPTEVQEKYLSPSAQKRWDSQWWRRLLFPQPAYILARVFINHTGLRVLLYKMGILKGRYPH